MSSANFEFSDTIAGYVVSRGIENDIFSMKTTDGREFKVKLSANIFARMLRNLGEPYLDCTGQLKDLLVPDQYLFAYGTFYPQGDGYAFEAQIIDFPGKKIGKYRFEEPDWSPRCPFHYKRL